MLTAIPAVWADTDLLPYDDAYTRECMPYALAAMLAVDEDRDLANVYSDMYTKLADKYLCVFAEDINDVYKEASEG